MRTRLLVGALAVAMLLPLLLLSSAGAAEAQVQRRSPSTVGSADVGLDSAASYLSSEWTVACALTFRWDGQAWQTYMAILSPPLFLDTPQIPHFLTVAGVTIQLYPALGATHWVIWDTFWDYEPGSGAVTGLYVDGDGTVVECDGVVPDCFPPGVAISAEMASTSAPCGSTQASCSLMSVWHEGEWHYGMTFSPSTGDPTIVVNGTPTGTFDPFFESSVLTSWDHQDLLGYGLNGDTDVSVILDDGSVVDCGTVEDPDCVPPGVFTPPGTRICGEDGNDDQGDDLVSEDPVFRRVGPTRKAATAAR